MFGALKRGFRSTASLILVRNVVDVLQPKRILAASRGFLVAARLSCTEDNRYQTYFVVNNVVVDVWITGKNFLQTHDIFTRCEELQICLNITRKLSTSQTKPCYLQQPLNSKVARSKYINTYSVSAQNYCIISG